MEEKKKMPTWIGYIHSRIKKNKNFLCMITGQTGSGKSWTALSLGEMLDEEFSSERVVFNGRELMSLINSGKLTKGSVIIWDEAGVELSSRSWQSQANKLINYLIQTFRHKNFILIFTAPYGDFIDVGTRKLFHAEFQTSKILMKEKKCRLKPKLLMYYPQLKKFYMPYLRTLDKEVGMVKKKRWDVPAPSEKLIKDYEHKKDKFTAALNRTIQAGLNKIEMEDNKENRKPLTDRQKEVMFQVANYGLEVACEHLGLGKNGVLHNRYAAEKKGYKLEEFKEETKK